MNHDLRHGLELIRAGRYEQVHGHALDLIRRDVDDPVPYCLLGQLALDHKNYIKAAELLDRSRQLAPDDPFYIAVYAQCLVTTGKQPDALLLADKAASLRIQDGWTADTIGVVYSRTGFHEKAVPLFELAVQLNPEPANFHYNLGASLQFSGDFSRAADAYEETVKRDPDAYRAYSSLVGLSRQTPERNRLSQLEFLFEKLLPNPDAALHLGHAIAKTLEDFDRHPESFDWLVRAKEGKRKAIEYELQGDLALFDAAAQTSQSSQSRESGATGTAAAGPIFVVGMPRTGTTLIDRILSSHSEVVSVGELNTFAGLIKSATATPSNRALDVETLENAPAADLASIGGKYIQDTQRLTRGAKRFVDKMPLNFFYAGLIKKALPGARIVILRRDPMDTCLSNFRQLFSTGFSYYNYSLDIEDTGHYHNAFDALMRHWMATLPSEDVIEVHYEDVIRHQEKQTRRLLDFCGLPFEERCLRFHENAAPVSTASSVQVRQPLYSDSIGRWRKYGRKLDGLKKVVKAAG